MPILFEMCSTGNTSHQVIPLRSLSTGGMYPLAGNTAVLEYTLTDLAFEAVISVQISGEYLGISFRAGGESECDKLVVWSWRRGVRILVSILGAYATMSSLTDLLSRFYQPLSDPLRFSATNLSWRLHRNHLRY